MVEGSLRIVRDDAGIWNRLTSEDAAIAVNQLNESARKHIMENGLIRQAEERKNCAASGKKPDSRKNRPERTAGSDTARTRGPAAIKSSMMRTSPFRSFYLAKTGWLL